MTDLLSRDELVRYFRTEEYADEIADIISNFPPADHLPNLPQTIAEGFANSLFNQGKIEVNWAGMSDEEKLAYLTAARDLPDLPQEAPEQLEIERLRRIVTKQSDLINWLDNCPDTAPCDFKCGYGKDGDASACYCGRAEWEKKRPPFVDAVTHGIDEDFTSSVSRPHGERGAS